MLVQVLEHIGLAAVSVNFPVSFILTVHAAVHAVSHAFGTVEGGIGNLSRAFGLLVHSSLGRLFLLVGVGLVGLLQGGEVQFESLFVHPSRVAVVDIIDTIDIIVGLYGCCTFYQELLLLAFVSASLPDGHILFYGHAYQIGKILILSRELFSLEAFLREHLLFVPDRVFNLL